MKRAVILTGCIMAALLGTAQAQEAAPSTPPDARPLGAEVRERHRLEMRDRFEQLRKRRVQRARAEQLRSEIDGELAKDKPDRAILQQKLAELAETRAERRRERQLSIRRRWGTLADREDVKQELERHARNQARLERMKFLAATERSGVARTRLLERLKRAQEAEAERHQRSMQALAPPNAPAAQSASSGASP